MVSHGIVWYFMVLHFIAFYFMILCGIACYPILLYGYALHGIVWCLIHFRLTDWLQRTGCVSQDTYLLYDNPSPFASYFCWAPLQLVQHNAIFLRYLGFEIEYRVVTPDYMTYVSATSILEKKQPQFWS